MFGDSILVNPIIEPEIRLLEAYFPRAFWYELWSGLRIEGLETMAKTEAIQAQIPSYIRYNSYIFLFGNDSLLIAKYTEFLYLQALGVMLPSKTNWSIK